MATDTVSKFQMLMTKANEYHQQALWQEKLRTLQNALEICMEDGFPKAEQRRQQVLFEIGGIRRRFGQYAQGVETLNQALKANEHASPIMRAKILGELGVIHRHSNEFALAQKTFREQYKLAYEMAIEAEAELCRAVGNEGMSNYNLSQQTKPQNENLLETALRQLEERVERAQNLHDRLSREEPKSRYVKQSIMWKGIGIDRLTLCYIAARNTAKAVSLAKESEQLQQGHGNEDPTVRGFSRFFYGNALWHNGEHEAALEQWSAPPGECSSPVSICKEPTAEHVEYLKLMADAGVDFNSYDEQGFSPLDYAVLSDNPDARRMIEIIVNAFRLTLRKEFELYVPKLSDEEIARETEKEIASRLGVANIRRYYRAILQEHIRPELRNQAVKTVPNLRRIYADLLANDKSMQSILDSFYFITYRDFKEYGRLPLADARLPGSKDRLARKFSDVAGTLIDTDNLFIIFFSYRWIGKTSDPPLEGPDDIHDTQYERMLNAVETLLKLRGLDPNNVGIWLDCVCINQLQPQQRDRGINALPLAITQCDAMISLVDETYYTRAWCAVEVMLIRELMQSYRRHDWFEHILDSPSTDRLKGALRAGRLQSQLDVSNLELTRESLDRSKIDFLLRQSKLLGRDDA